MACRKAYEAQIMNAQEDAVQASITQPAVAKTVERLLFGVHSKVQADDLLQNNIDQFEWVVRINTFFEKLKNLPPKKSTNI